MTNSIERQSNFELLRILAMSFIVLGHIVLHAADKQLPGSVAIESVCIIGVNLFVLISGYFTIQFKFKSFFHLICISIFYSLLSAILAWLIFKRPISGSDIPDIILQISNNKYYWFIGCYLQLMMISPFLNILLQKLTNLYYLGLICVMAYLSCISGWLFNNQINLNGYNVFNMLFLYLIGFGIYRFSLHKFFAKRTWILIFILCSVVIYLMKIYMPGHASRYNNPIVIISAIALFSFFANINFHSNVVNALAKCMLPVYLLQEGFVGLELYKYLYNIGLKENFTGGVYSCYLICYTLLLFVGSFMIEYARSVFVLWFKNAKACIKAHNII